MQDFTFRFAPGHIYCLAGHSGAGKSTLFNVLLGLVTPTKGQAILNLSEVAQTHPYPIGYLPQQVMLFRGSVAEHVAYPNPSYDPIRVRAALAEVAMTKVTQSLPEGIDTMLGEGFHGLSGGQAQRLLLARLIYHNSPFLLIDEGTSALDPETEVIIQQCLRAITARGATVIAIAHRASVVDQADHILILDQGTLVSSGSKNEVTQSRHYQNLFGRTGN